MATRQTHGLSRTDCQVPVEYSGEAAWLALPLSRFRVDGWMGGLVGGCSREHRVTTIPSHLSINKSLGSETKLRFIVIKSTYLDAQSS